MTQCDDSRPREEGFSQEVCAEKATPEETLMPIPSDVDQPGIPQITE